MFAELKIVIGFILFIVHLFDQQANIYYVASMYRT